MVYYSEDYLCHYGIKGQKWGLRRFQKPNGTLTPEGRERYFKNPVKDYYDTNKKFVANAQGAGAYLEREDKDTQDALNDALDHIHFYENEMKKNDISEAERYRLKKMYDSWIQKYEKIFNEANKKNFKTTRALENKYGIEIYKSGDIREGAKKYTVSSKQLSNMGQLVKGVKKQYQKENSTMNKIKKTATSTSAKATTSAMKTAAKAKSLGDEFVDNWTTGMKDIFGSKKKKKKSK